MCLALTKEMKSDEILPNLKEYLVFGALPSLPISGFHFARHCIATGNQ